MKLQTPTGGLTSEEHQLVKVLIAKNLVRYVGPEQKPAIHKIQDISAAMQLAAMAYFELTGVGIDLIQRWGEEAIREGKFNWTDEIGWYDRWPWKLVWPVFASIVTTLVVQWIRGGK